MRICLFRYMYVDLLELVAAKYEIRFNLLIIFYFKFTLNCCINSEKHWANWKIRLLTFWEWSDLTFSISIIRELKHRNNMNIMTHIQCLNGLIEKVHNNFSLTFYFISIFAFFIIYFSLYLILFIYCISLFFICRPSFCLCLSVAR